MHSNLSLKFDSFSDMNTQTHAPLKHIYLTTVLFGKWDTGPCQYNVLHRHIDGRVLLRRMYVYTCDWFKRSFPRHGREHGHVWNRCICGRTGDVFYLQEQDDLIAMSGFIRLQCLDLWRISSDAALFLCVYSLRSSRRMQQWIQRVTVTWDGCGIPEWFRG